ncbi:MAG: hypothetical protein K0S65_6430 [Labilithrix sp.]|nr:hypothetical protein [Labilithrix sp.]
MLHSLVREHLETFLAHARETYGAPLPKYVEDEFREYLRCGVFAHGLLRARCEACHHDLLVAFSCKKRAVCPSCAGRRMANEAAALVDRVLPAVPVRQWVLSLPFELRALAAFDAKVLAAFSRSFADAVGQWYRDSAEHAGIEHGEAARTGAVTFVQRFGSSLNLNVHFHTCFLDGVYVRDPAENLVFHGAPPPNRDDLEGVVKIVHQRILRWLARHGHLERPPLEERSNEPALRSPIEACAAIATQRGTTRLLARDADSSQLASEGGGTDAEAPAREAGAVEAFGFNLHASVRIDAVDDRGRERLCRYGARPPFSLEPLRLLPGGRVAYRIKKLGGGRAKHRVMTPLELLARFAALVPPPRYPLVRYHGVLAPHAAWRREIVPRPPIGPSSRIDTAGAAGERTSCGRSSRGDTAPVHRGASGGFSVPREQAGRADESARRPSGAGPTDAAGDIAEHVRPLSASPGAAASAASADVTNLAPNILSVRHWSRLLNGVLYATSPRLRWPQLLQRTFDVDILECPKCHGRIQVVEAVLEKDAVRSILERLDLPVDAPRLVRARDPTTLDGEEPDAP